jgi:membrane-bound serine protease (ClpP class)
MMNRLAIRAFIVYLALIAASVAAVQSDPGNPLVHTAEIDAVIHPVSAQFMREAIDRADASGASLLVFTLRTPGGLVESTEEIVTRMLAAKTPIAVFVGPSGARAASAGFIILLASDLAVMAPGTHIGAAAPVLGTGQPMDDTMAKKATEDLAARARTLAARRGRNIALANEAVTKARAFTEDEALRAVDPETGQSGAPLIDFIASDVGDLLKKADGRAVIRSDGTTVTLSTANATLVSIEMTWRQLVLSAIAHPNIAFLLLSLGTLGLTIELWNPGAVLPGVVGGLCLLLAFFAFKVLPINFAGLLLILFGLVLLILEVKVTSYGLLSVGGLASLFFGALMLIDAPASGLRVSMSIIAPVTLGMAGILMFLVRIGVRAQRQRAVTGVAGMLNQRGRAVTPITPGAGGRVSAHGELWSATADEPIAQGEDVQIVGIEGLTLTVRRASRDEERRSA